MLDRQQADLLEEATELYRGELLEGWYQDWCLFERERFQYMFLGMLDKLMGYCEGLRAYEEGIAYGMQILRRDQAREHTHRRLMRLHFLSGNRTEALRQFHRCAAILMDELGVQPADETHQLYQQIQENRLDLSPSQVRGAGPNPSRSLLALDGLKAVQTELLSLQRRLRQEIELVELVLKGRR
ncbi:MAG: bacterial transcriptional activator domain-containing protein [Chloroflexi bacterium]|nr:bacterial transcriptional activator domain-containing protein [Chloroflexota bacterium]MCI0729001.1 bacterial transcriptional activator domain-containing protein [Chloroflexota bacterium]